jgi:hypothetical protein
MVGMPVGDDHQVNLPRRKCFRKEGKHLPRSPVRARTDPGVHQDGLVWALKKQAVHGPVNEVGIGLSFLKRVQQGILRDTGEAGGHILEKGLTGSINQHTAGILSDLK